jgi:threonine dehydrogenase-like Zn-dependent dehydrogenase
VGTPSPGPGEVLLKTAYCGVCGSDLPRLVKDAAHYYPIVLGHEFSGVIENVGSGVDSGLIGRKAVCAPLIPNFNDPECAKGNYCLGIGYDFIGTRIQGGYAEYVVMPIRNAVLAEDSADLLAASFLEPLTVGLHAINIMDLPVGRPMALTGAGGIGLLLLQSLKQLGGESITAFDVDERQLELAHRLGADFCVNSSDEVAVAEAVNKITPRGFAAVFETSGAPPAEILSLKLAAPKGLVMFIGTPHTPFTLQPEEFELLNRKELTLKGSWMNYSAPFPGWEWEFGVMLLAKGRIRVHELIGKIVPLSEAARIPELLHGPNRVKGKLVLDCLA